MSPSVYFVQECPVCGRPVQIRVAYLGQQVTCQHCGGRFMATDATSRFDGPTGVATGLLDRAQQLIEQSALRLAMLRGAA
ncbi:MAG: hypothetical protein ABFD16_23595 [Thermoguttaceae bacterium]